MKRTLVIVFLLGAATLAVAQVTQRFERVIVTRPAIGVTTTDGLTVQNPTPAALGAQQWSPAIDVTGAGWATTGGASVPLTGRLELQAVQGSTNPTGNLTLSGRVGAGAWAELLRISINSQSATFAGSMTTSAGPITTASNSSFNFGSARARAKSSADALFNLWNSGETFGVQVNTGTAAPTVSSGGGTSPAIVTGARNAAGSVNVGTGGSATQIVIAFGAPAWTNAPHCTAAVRTATAADVRAHGVTTTTTALTLTAAAAWASASIVAWTCQAPL